jgi:hypothetical protein
MPLCNAEKRLKPGPIESQGQFFVRRGPQAALDLIDVLRSDAIRIAARARSSHPAGAAPWRRGAALTGSSTLRGSDNGAPTEST